MDRWMRLLRDIFLMQLLRRDGCGKASTTLCPRCKVTGNLPKYRCRECAGGLLLCRSCCLDEHVSNPLHMIEEWNGIFFDRRPLKEMGQRIQLGHSLGERCLNPHGGHTGFVVLHDNGIHTVDIDFCGCEGEGRTEHYLQLLQFGWFPATDERPQTAASFQVLDNFHLHTLQAKTTAYDFYAVLERLTNNAGVKPPDRYQVFLRMARQYRHLLLLKRAGRGHDITGVWGTAAGECALQCPCCPDPKVNLPEGWDNAAPEDRFLYVFFLALDACFRLKRRMISNEIRDPGLGTGWVYVMENAPYRHFLLKVTDQKEMSTCSGLAALDFANTKFSRGYSTTGVGMGVCARHEFVQANGVGDLQKGERFANMDYIFGSILRHKDSRIRKIISYDIVCQWWKLLADRMILLPPLVRLALVLSLFRFVIPKMHIHAHTLACQVQFSLNLVPGSGQTDGEGIERPWATIGAIATSTRVSGPGARHDMLDDHWNFWNWLKTIGLALILRRRLDAARLEQARQREAFTSFSVQQADRVPTWKEMVETFERDPSKTNPYTSEVKGLTEMEVRLQYAKEEEEDALRGVPSLHEVTPSGFITAGLDLEEQQYAQTTAMQINMRALRTKLNRDVDRFRKLQATYTPGAIQALAARVAPGGELVEDTPLMLPSAMTVEQRAAGGCSSKLLDIEKSLRGAQCRTALVRLRRQLHIKSRLLLYKKNHSRAQHMNTRSRTIVARNESKIRLHSEKFQMAWEAQLRIAGGEAGMEWPRLRKADIRCMQDAEQGGESVREVSWIWTVAGTAGTDEELEDALRIEWAKSWARSRRWTEEVRLLEEEWRRLPVTFAYRQQQWVDRAAAVQVGGVDVEIAEGRIAYALKQANLYKKLAEQGEVTRTEVKLARGKKRRVVAPSWDSVLGVEGEQTEGGLMLGGDEGLDDDDEDDDERGDVESDEELLMGGEVDQE
ncbi:hypothetical protein C8R47DRAFT_962737 [Mycena vitilis]|nr:hypothetical protein C8R47DRAFT_962737 [Mycena vitilis]